MTGMAAEETRKRTLDLRPLFFEAFVCSLAMMSFVALIGPIARACGLAPWQAGSVMTVGGLAWMLAASVWGAASDRRGRRPVMLTGLAGFCLCTLALSALVGLALADPMPAGVVFAGLVALRALDGAFYAAVPVTGAALVADHLPPAQRVGALAGLGAASGLGMVAGPGLVGLLAGYGLALPLLVTAAAPLVALAVLWRWLPRAAPPAASGGPRLSLRDRRVRRPVVLAFAAMLCVAIAQVSVGFFALDRLGLEPAAAGQAAGIALTVVGVALIAAQILLRRLSWSPERLVGTGGLVAAAGFASVMIADTRGALWAGYFVAAWGMGWVFPSVSALAANAVEAREQGAVAGLIGSAHGLGMILGPVLGTAVYGLDGRAPYVLIAVILAVAGVAASGPFGRRRMRPAG